MNSRAVIDQLVENEDISVAFSIGKSTIHLKLKQRAVTEEDIRWLKVASWDVFEPDVDKVAFFGVLDYKKVSGEAPRRRLKDVAADGVLRSFNRGYTQEPLGAFVSVADAKRLSAELGGDTYDEEDGDDVMSIDPEDEDVVLSKRGKKITLLSNENPEAGGVSVVVNGQIDWKGVRDLTGEKT
jgi:hypothetical protein